MYGAHLSVAYARVNSVKTSLSALTHHFLPYDATALKLQPGGPGYELVYSITAIPEYLRSLSPAGTLEAGYAAIAEYEQTLIHPLLTYLKNKESRGVRIVGDETADLSRVPTISFIVVGPQRKDSREIVKVFDEAGNVSPPSWLRAFPLHVLPAYSFHAFRLCRESVDATRLIPSFCRIPLVHWIKC